MTSGGSFVIAAGSGSFEVVQIFPLQAFRTQLPEVHSDARRALLHTLRGVARLMPVRVKLSRKKGWKMPEGAVMVSRPSKWGNPYVVGLVSCSCRTVDECYHNTFHCETAEEAVEAYRSWMEMIQEQSPKRHDLEELRGKDLACWCDLENACHASVLLEMANE